MMKAVVYNNETLAGYLEKRTDGTFVFTYAPEYLEREDAPPISLTLPKTRKEYQSDTLFPFFCGLLPEGVNKDIQCRLLKIDEADDFGHLLRVAGSGTIGAVTVKPLSDDL